MQVTVELDHIAKVIDEAIADAMASYELGLEQRLKQMRAELPKGERGEKGDRGDPGDRGERGEKGDKGDAGDHGEKGDRGDVGPAGEIGPKGDNGRDGRDGMSVAGPRGERGERGEPGADGAQGPIGPAGPQGEIGTPGLGYDDVTASFDERGIHLTATRGEQKRELGTFAMGLLYRGIWKEGPSYWQGNAVTYGGSLWIAHVETTDKPGTSKDWQLAVKRGNDGKDGKSGKDGQPGPEGRPGRDLTQISLDGREKWS